MRHIELIHFICNNCGVEIFMDSKTATKRRKIGPLICNACYKKRRNHHYEKI